MKRNWLHLLWLGVGLVGLLSGALAQQTADRWTAQLPEGKGKALVQDACVQCHSLESTVMQRKDRTSWKKTVNDMILRGAFITPTEAETIIEYLSTALGSGGPQRSDVNASAPLDLNTASPEQMLRVTPLERAEVEGILEYRRRHGPFRSLDDLKKVKAVKPERFEKIKLFFSVASTNTKPVSKAKPD